MKDTIVVTHPGPAHRDEFISCCLLIGDGQCRRIERRQETTEDLVDPRWIVLDQGGRHEPELNNFDHHQFDRDADPACSITLILPLFGISPKRARDIWTWFEFSELLDSKGPFETAKRLGSTPDALFAGISPVEETVLRWFSEQEVILPHSPLWELMARIGAEKLDYIESVVDRIHFHGESASVVEVNGLTFLDATWVDRKDQPTLGLEMFCQEQDQDRDGTAIAGTITQDDRGDGLALFRRNDHPRVDFSSLEGEDGVIFAHKGGFIAKLAAGVDPLPLLAKAVAGKA